MHTEIKSELQWFKDTESHNAIKKRPDVPGTLLYSAIPFEVKEKKKAKKKKKGKKPHQK